MLPGIEVKPIKKLADERGFFHELMRQDWDIFEDDLGGAGVQANTKTILTSKEQLFMVK